MRKLTLLALAVLSTAAGTGNAGCGAHQRPVADVALGRVVVYRNGIAYFERRAQLTGDSLEIAVPTEKIDDFLKSLTVRDAATGKSLPVSFPSRPVSNTAVAGMVNMTIRLPPNVATDVVLTYITEAPAWKPSYRIVVNKDGKVKLEGWAIVDNASGEDWHDVLVGVGSSSALSFRYDLWSIRNVARQTLGNEQRLALAPPKGSSPYYRQMDKASDRTVVAEFGDGQFNVPLTHPGSTASSVRPNQPAPPPRATSATRQRFASHTKKSARALKSGRASEPAMEPPYEDSDDNEHATNSRSVASDLRSVARRRGKAAGKAGLRRRARREAKGRLRAQRQAAASRRRYQQNQATTRKLAAKLKASGRHVVIEGFAAMGDKNAEQSGFTRANVVRNQLIENGVPPTQLEVRSADAKAGQPAGVRLIAAKTATDEAAPVTDDSPVGESNFQSKVPISIPHGTSAMVSVVNSITDGNVVYLYDAESSRGNSRFAFKAVRLENPTTSTLEAGPVTVYGDKRFIGEGLTDPVPPKSRALIPFALDRQVLVERKQTRSNRIVRLTTLQRGVLTTEVAHSLITDMTITNRLAKPVTLYVRHAVTKGWTLDDPPAGIERIGRAYLVPVNLAARQTRSLHLQESTPLVKTLDLRSADSMAMVQAFISHASDYDALATKMKPVLALHRKLVDERDAIASLRGRMSDYRVRMDELEGQIVSLKEVKSGRQLLRHLEQKMREISARVQKSTFELVELQEQQMLTRIELQDGIAEMTMTPNAKPKTAKR